MVAGRGEGVCITRTVVVVSDSVSRLLLAEDPDEERLRLPGKLVEDVPAAEEEDCLPVAARPRTRARTSRKAALATATEGSAGVCFAKRRASFPLTKSSGVCENKTF